MAPPEPSGAENLPRRERRRLEVRRRILEAADQLFYTQGFDATSVIELAERADVAKKTLFNHFPTKQHVLQALAMRVFENLLVDVETARKAKVGTGERLAAFFGRVDRLVAGTGPAARDMAFALVRVTQETGMQPAEVARFRGALVEMIRDGVTRGEVTRRHDPETLAESISAIYFGLILNWALNESFPIARKTREAAAFLADALERRPGET